MKRLEAGNSVTVGGVNLTVNALGKPGASSSNVAGAGSNAAANPGSAGGSASGGIQATVTGGQSTTGDQAKV